jgi:hypothetical protein
MVGPSLKLHKIVVGDILYYITNHPTSSTKKPKHMHLCMTNKDIQAIVQISIDPKFEIKDFLNELQNEWMILGKHECFHQIHHDIIILFFQFLRQISKTYQYFQVCAQLQETPIELLQKLHKQLARKKTLTVNNVCYFSHNCPSEEATSLVMASHPQLYP